MDAVASVLEGTRGGEGEDHFQVSGGTSGRGDDELSFGVRVRACGTVGAEEAVAGAWAGGRGCGRLQHEPMAWTWRGSSGRACSVRLRGG